MWHPRPRPTGPASARVRVALPEPVGDGQLRIYSYGVREWMAPGLIHRPRGTDEYLLMAFNHAAEVEVDGALAPAPADSVIVWRPHMPHRYGHAERIWCHTWLHVDGAALDGWLTAAGLPLDRPLAPVEPRLLERCVLAVHDELAALPQPDGAILGNHLHTCVRQLARVVHGVGAGRLPARLLAVRHHLETRYAERITLAGLAAIAGCSVQHFCAEFRRHLGAAPIDYLIRLRLAQARLLLRDRNAGVAEVARAVGYDDYHHFTKLFRRRYGVPPSTVRGASRGRTL
jgi:AraC family transcriptional regulator of arabinose operon